MSGRERHHVVDVLRLPIGADVTLFDGRGSEARAIVVEITQERVEFELKETPRREQRNELPLTVAVAAPKGARGDWLVEKCAEIGVCRLVFIDTQRGEVRPGEGKLERWRRKAIEAAKQSGAANVMQIDAGRSLHAICDGASDRIAIYFGTTLAGASGFHSELSALSGHDESAVACVCVIGPEGGFSNEEIDTLQRCGARPMSLGRSTLRVETAAIAAAAIWAAFVSERGA